MQVAEGLEWINLYWYYGVTPRRAKYHNAVTDPPCSGWSSAFVIRGEKRSTLFCPYSFQAWPAANDCMELALCREPDKFTPDFMRDMMETKWEQFQRWGFQKDYDTCALVMRRLGWPVPEQIMTGGGADDRKKGGKEVGTRLLKPVKADSKRGRFLKWFLEGGGAMPVREAMAEFAMTRSNALSYLYMIQKDHGIGYVLVGDTATVTLPEGCTDPFNEPTPVAPGTEDDDNSWLD